MTMTPAALVTVEEACRLLSVSRSMLYKLVKQGEIELIKVGGRTRFRRTDLETLVSVDEACRLLWISRSMLYKLVKRGQLEIFKVGSCTRFRRSDIQAFVERLGS